MVPEELLSHISTVTGERPARLLRADMTYAELPSGGAVFAVGSITFCGSLSHNRYDNSVSTILKNVIERFRTLSSAAPRASWSAADRRWCAL